MKWLGKTGKGVVVLLALFGAYQLIPKTEPVIDVYYPSDFSQAPDGIVGFPSFNAVKTSDFRDAGATAVKQTSGGLLVMPASASLQHKVPAVVILHGSGGDWSGRSVYLANRLAKHGIAGLAVNTFAARDLRKSDPYLTRLKKAPIFTQLSDGLMALKALQDHPHIDTDKIAVAGFSLGAANALYSMFEPVTEHVLGSEGPRFSAYVAYYAGCSFDFEDFRPEGSPVLMMMGEKDESMSIPACDSFRDKLINSGVQASLKVYPGAGHGWELPYPMSFDDGAVVTKDCQMLWTRDYTNIEQSTGHNVDTTLGAIRAFSSCSNKDGYTMGLHQPTKEQAWQDTLSFLTDVWQSKSTKTALAATRP